MIVIALILWHEFLNLLRAFHFYPIYVIESKEELTIANKKFPQFFSIIVDILAYDIYLASI